ncbi:hypothetical protein V2J09_021189 [Rumex salicifolius]
MPKRLLLPRLKEDRETVLLEQEQEQDMGCRFIPLVFRPSPPFFSLVVKPLSVSAALPPRLHSFPLLPPPPPPSPFHLNSRALCRHIVVSVPCFLPSECDSVSGLQFDDSGDAKTEDDAELHGSGESGVRVLSDLVEKRSVPDLTVKEKKELASYAHSLGDKLKSQQIGKSGVTANVFSALNETLEANELIKLKIHRTCPGEVDDIVKQLEQGTGSVAIGQIGRTVIFYRPSLSKLKAVEKKKQARKVFLQRKLKFSPTLQVSRESGPSRRGSSKYSTNNSI